MLGGLIVPDWTSEVTGRGVGAIGVGTTGVLDVPALLVDVAVAVEVVVAVAVEVAVGVASISLTKVHVT